MGIKVLYSTRKQTMSATEYVILVDENNQEIGQAEKMAAHEQCLLHRAFSVFIYRDKPQRELLIQQRADDKYHAGGLWTNTCCSHPRPGEDVIAAGERRLQEELGISAKLKSLGWFQYTAHFTNGLAENEIDYVLVGKIDADQNIIANPQEVQAFRWVTIDILRAELASSPEKFTPWFARALEVALKTFN